MRAPWTVLKEDLSVCRHLLQRLGHNADIGDARLLNRVHDGSEGAERDILVSAYKNKLLARIANLLP